MKNFTLFLLLIITNLAFSQTTFFWRSEAVNGDWDVDDNWWNGSTTQQPQGNEIIRFDNNEQINMTNNLGNTSRFQLFFDGTATTSRTISGTSENTFFDFGGNKPKIENSSSVNHTIAFPVKIGFNPMEINPVNGDLTFNTTINNNGNFIDVFGDNSQTLIFNGVISGTGGIALKQNSAMIFNSANTFSGNTVLEAGTLILKEDLAFSNITVMTGATLIIDGDNITIPNLIVDAGGTVTISKAKGLTITGNLTNNGSVTLESDSDEYSSLIVNGTVTGNVNYNRHVNITATTGQNDLISAPVTGQTFGSFASANSNIVTNPANTTQKLFGPFDKSTANYQIYNTVDNALTILDEATGYRAASTDDGTFTFTGDVNTGTVTKSILNSGPSFAKWNVIGNPYPSYIKLSDFLITNSAQFDDISSGVYGYDGNASDGYVIWNFAYLSNPANANAVITPGQGFLVASKPEGGSVTFNPAIRTTGTTDDFIPMRTEFGGNFGFLRLKVSNATNDYETDFYFNDNSTLGLDPGYDASVFGNNAQSFSLYSQLVEDNTGVDFAIQSIGFSSLSDVSIPLGLNVTQGQQVTVSISEAILPPSTLVVLEDNIENTFTPLQNGSYTFTANTTLTDVGRFFLRFTDETLSTNTLQVSDLQVFVTAHPDLVHIKGLLSTTKVNILDIQGRLVLSSVVDSNANTLDVSSLKSGVYVVQLNSKSQNKNQKIIIR